MQLPVEIAYAKINLALHIRRRRDDGYHELETLFAFVDDGDVLSAELADDISLNVIGPFGEGLSNGDNLVVRAAKLVQANFLINQGAAITLDKRLPVASGIGGGSADAAAIARLLRRIWSVDVDDVALEQLLAPLGADIPACVGSQTRIGYGIGTELVKIENDLSGTHVLMVNPRIALETKTVFSGWWGHDQGPIPTGTARDVALYGRNDLEGGACDLVNEIADVLEMLRATRAFVARMSGSGATCFGLYHNIDELARAQKEISRKRPEWWQLAGRLR